jgi:hypothetical protein
VGTAIVEWIPEKSPVDFDLVPSLIQDTALEGGTALLLAVGPDVTRLMKNGMTVSFATQIVGVIGDTSAGVTINPIVNIGTPISSKK